MFLHIFIVTYFFIYRITMTHRFKIFSGLSDNLKLVAEKLKQDRDERPEREVKLQDFWKEYEQSVCAVSAECTKLCLAFSSAPQPSSSGCEMFKERVESAVLLLVSTVYKLPKSQGKTLYNQIFEHTHNIVLSVEELALIISEHAKSTSKTTLQCTGGVWELCDTVTNLPRDSKQLTLGLLEETIGLVQDALTELENSIRVTESKAGFDQDDEDSDDIGQDWSETDKNICHACIGLIKTTKSLYKKCHSSLKKHSVQDGLHNIEDLEICISQSKEASPCIDNVIEALYPPLSGEHVLSKSDELVSSLRMLLMALPKMYFIGEEDITWIEFLGKAVDHNWTKVQTVSVST